MSQPELSRCHRGCSSGCNCRLRNLHYHGIKGASGPTHARSQRQASAFFCMCRLRRLTRSHPSPCVGHFRLTSARISSQNTAPDHSKTTRFGSRTHFLRDTPPGPKKSSGQGTFFRAISSIFRGVDFAFRDIPGLAPRGPRVPDFFRQIRVCFSLAARPCQARRMDAKTAGAQRDKVFQTPKYGNFQTMQK